MWGVGLTASGIITIVSLANWSQRRVEAAKEGSASEGVLVQEVGHQAMTVLAGGTALAFWGFFHSYGMISQAAMLTGAVVAILGLVRVVVDLFAPTQRLK